MMHKIITLEEAIEISDQLRDKKKRIVLAGGVFDIIHKGHLAFLQKAKTYGDVLFILIESDEAVKKKKGEMRPIHPQQKRATILEAVIAVDYIVLLQGILTNKDYEDFVITVKPAIIAATKGDPFAKEKKRQAKLSNGTYKEIIDPIENVSTSR